MARSITTTTFATLLLLVLAASVAAMRGNGDGLGTLQSDGSCRWVWEETVGSDEDRVDWNTLIVRKNNATGDIAIKLNGTVPSCWDEDNSESNSYIFTGHFTIEIDYGNLNKIQPPPISFDSGTKHDAQRSEYDFEYEGVVHGHMLYDPSEFCGIAHLNPTDTACKKP